MAVMQVFPQRTCGWYRASKESKEMLTELNVPISELQSHMVPSQWSMMKRGRVISFLGNVYIYTIYIHTYLIAMLLVRSTSHMLASILWMLSICRHKSVFEVDEESPASFFFVACSGVFFPLVAGPWIRIISHNPSHVFSSLFQSFKDTRIFGFLSWGPSSSNARDTLDTLGQGCTGYTQSRSPKSWLFIMFFTCLIPGEMIQFDEHMFQMGWFEPPAKYPP